MGFFNRFRKKEGEPVETASDRPPAKAAQSGQTAGQGNAPAREAAATPVPIPQVKEMSAEDLKARLDRGETPLLIDVRENWEYQIVHLPQAVFIPMNTVPAKIGELDKRAEIVVYCHHGTRSWNVVAYMRQQGFTNVSNLTGGIDAWARRIDRTLRTY